MSCSCVEGKYPINIIQGDSYHNAYTFYDKDGKVITAEHIGAVYWNCARLEYQQELEYNVEDSSWIFYLSSTETADFAYCKTTYDLTLYFTDEQVETEIYSSELRVLEKKNKPSADVYSGGEPFDVNGITTNIYTGLIVTAGGGGTNNHAALINRDLPNQHSMSAITGLEEALESKADSDDIPTKTSEIENDSDFVDQTYVGGIEQTLQSNIDGVQTDVDNIEAVISTQATPTNKLVSASEMGDAISAVEAKQLYATSSQGSFATKAQLLSATTYYNADGTVATPTKNDVAYVLADESHDNKSAKYVIADITSSGIVWGFVITFSDVTFTQSQMDAVNSGVTSGKISTYDSYASQIAAKYSKPSGGIPKTDLASAVQTSLGKADSALQAADLNGYATEQYVNNHHDSTKQDVISDLDDIRSGAALGATALQAVPNTYRTAAQQDIIDNGKQPVGDYAQRSELFSGNYNDLTNKPTIPSAVTESTVSGWGFTKNTGTYSKPSTGIPKTDLASAVQTSLGKADTALQSVPTTYALKTDIPTDAHINSLIDNKIGNITTLINNI